MPLQNTYRAEKLEELYGNRALKESLQSVLSREKDIPHVYLLSGKSGCGKSTIAQIIRRKLGIHDNEVFVYNTSDDRGIGTVREIISGSMNLPMFGTYKMYVLEECHQLSPAACEALLVPLENPAKHSFFVLCTTEPHELPETLRRRCHTYEVELLADDDMYPLIKKVLQSEGVLDSFSNKVIGSIVKTSNGSPGVALKLLDMVIDIENEESALKLLQNQHLPETELSELGRAICDISQNGKTRFKICIEKMKKINADPEAIRQYLCNYISGALMKHPIDIVADILNCFLFKFDTAGKAGLLWAIHQSCKFTLKG